uniref:Glycerophosphodiester phosphodiesterase domain containing 5b n=1 Tax=Gadus morhua TaxID=8049 RepID=A0A8C4YVB7_GADMO
MTTMSSTVCCPRGSLTCVLSGCVSVGLSCLAAVQPLGGLERQHRAHPGHHRRRLHLYCIFNGVGALPCSGRTAVKSALAPQDRRDCCAADHRRRANSCQSSVGAGVGRGPHLLAGHRSVPPHRSSGCSHSSLLGRSWTGCSRREDKGPGGGSAAVPRRVIGSLPGPPLHHLSLHHGAQRAQTTARRHRPPGSSHGFDLRCQRPYQLHSPGSEGRAGGNVVTWLAPENTLMSFQRALQMNVTGLEADVTISVDGVPFLMRDRTLRRTTDVEKVFPDRHAEDASFFNWTDLRQLNAGQWFLEDDPFWTVHTLSEGEKREMANQSVCSLEQLLALAAPRNRTVVFRLRRPPAGHPCHHSWINDTLEAVHSARVPLSLVMWTPDEDRDQVRRMAPELLQTSLRKQSPQALHQQGVGRLLLRYNLASAQDVREFSQSNVSLALHTVNEPWLYSVLWCSGVPAVSSDAPHVLKKLLSPVWLLRPAEYCLIWVSADLVSFAVVVGIFIFQNYHMIRFRMSGMRSYNPEQIMLKAAGRRSSQDVNIMKEKLIFSEVSNGIGTADELYMENSYDYYTNEGITQ